MSNSRTLALLFLAAALAGCGSGSDEDEEPSNRPPVARINLSPESGPAPLAVTVSGETSTDPDGSITAYAWTFGDGSSASGARVEHAYAAVGAYEVRLTVTDNSGATSIASATVVATGSTVVYDGSSFDESNYEDTPDSGTYDSTLMQ